MKLVLILVSVVLWSSGRARASSFSITMDDPNLYRMPLLTGAERDDRIRAALRLHSHRAALFVNGQRIDDKPGAALVKSWSDEGHLIGNHSYSHLNFNAKDVTLDAYWTDLVKGEGLVKSLAGFARWFRFPFLKEGDTLDKRDGLRQRMRELGYRNGAVSVDASDWYVSSRLEARLRKDPKSDTTAYRDFYLAHLWDRAQFYDGLARRLTGREIAHTILVHHNLLNALYLGDLIAHFKAKGWKLVDAKTAFTDPIYKSEPAILPAGESVVWALAKGSGKYSSELRYPAEDGDYEKPKMDALGL